MSGPFLLEIGTEEIPAWMITRGLAQLCESVEAILLRNQLNFGGIGTDATPRRLVVRIDGVQDRRDDEQKYEKGPPVSAGDRAKQKFLEKMGGDENGLCVDSSGTRYQYLRLIPGRDTAEILAELLPEAILSIHWPKTMYWRGKDAERFIRPIRWVVASFCDSVVPFEIAGLKTVTLSQGHRVLGSAAIPVTFANFEQQLEANGVILSANKRRKKIEDETARLLEGSGLRVRPDPALLETLVYITEFPTPILGGFDSQYLELPQEVLVTVMRHHQKYLSVEDASGKLAPHFIAVMNTNADAEGLVRHGNERVLRARFNDARFFWEVDQKKKLVDRLDDLKNVTFQAKLGSYFDKTERVVNLVKKLGGDASTQRAALLAKCDLTTDMVKEFTDLQGIVGGLYARTQGEPEEVARAIYDHYRPLSMEDEIPASVEGRIVGLADKWDTLTSCFGVGMAPTGSKDPFALRRAAQGVVRIIVEGKMKFDFSGADEALREFMRDRIEYYFRDVRGFAYDEVRACMAAGFADLIDLEARLKRVQAVRPTPDFEPLAASFKRIKNILKQAEFAGGGELNENLIEAGPERELYNEIRRTDGQPLESRIGPLRPKVDLFFDKVLVNAKDEAVRRNRLTLLHNLLTEFSTIADFSEIVTERETRNEKRETNL